MPSKIVIINLQYGENMVEKRTGKILWHLKHIKIQKLHILKTFKEKLG